MLSKLFPWFVSNLTGLRKSQRKTLAALVIGVIQSPSAGIAAIGRHMLGSSLPKSRINRANRFLSNPRIDINAACAHLLLWLAAKRQEVFLSLDWTDLNNGLHQTLMLSVNARGRAIPILWRTVWKNDLRHHQNHVEEDLLRTLRRIAPPDLKIVIVADRGFARVAQFLLGNELGFHFIIRVRRYGGGRGRCGDGVGYSFRARKGTRHDFGRADFRDRDPYRVRLVLIYDRGQREPWLLATDLQGAQDRIVAGYAHRMEIEESLKDIKNRRHGWKLRGVDISTPERCDRMFLIILWRVGELVFKHYRPSLRALQKSTSRLYLVCGRPDSNN
ncbi:MAG: transposase [Thermaerobacter sp.]|jgi:hypothetical protein|nr:transposase [Thermaerobacter sp.]